MSKINKEALNDLKEMINKMNKSLEFYKSGEKIAKNLNVAIPVFLKNKIAGLAAMESICERVEYYYSSKDDILFGEWIIANDHPSQAEINIAIDLLNQYRKLKFEVGNVEYFIPDELCRK